MTGGRDLRLPGGPGFQGTPAGGNSGVPSRFPGGTRPKNARNRRFSAISWPQPVANTYTGTTTITSGTLIVNNASALSSAALVVNTNGLDLNGFNASAGALSGSSTGVIQSNVAGAARLITNSSSNGTYAGVITNGTAGGTVGYTKQGTGTQFLTGTSTYTGSTVVEGGSLYVNGQLGNTATSVNAGGLLSGNGTILGAVTVLSGGTISAGQDASSTGTLTVGSLTLNSGATTALTINGETAGSTYDQIVATGTTTFGGALTIDMNYAGGTFDANPANGTFWQLYASGTSLGNLTSITMTGTYGTLSFTQVSGIDGRWESPYLGNGKEFTFFTSGPYAGRLIAVPEPSTITLAAVGCISALGLGWHRRRRSTGG